MWRQKDVLSSRRADLQAARQGLIITEARPPRKPVSGGSAGAYSNQTASTPPGVNISAIQQLNGNLSPRMCGAAAQGLGPGIGGDHTITTCHVTSKMCHVLCRIDSKASSGRQFFGDYFFQMTQNKIDETIATQLALQLLSHKRQAVLQPSLCLPTP